MGLRIPREGSEDDTLATELLKSLNAALLAYDELYDRPTAGLRIARPGRWPTRSSANRGLAACLLAALPGRAQNRFTPDPRAGGGAPRGR